MFLFYWFRLVLLGDDQASSPTQRPRKRGRPQAGSRHNSHDRAAHSTSVEVTTSPKLPQTRRNCLADIRHRTGDWVGCEQGKQGEHEARFFLLASPRLHTRSEKHATSEKALRVCEDQITARPGPERIPPEHETLQCHRSFFFLLVQLRML